MPKLYLVHVSGDQREQLEQIVSRGKTKLLRSPALAFSIKAVDDANDKQGIEQRWRHR